MQSERKFRLPKDIPPEEYPAPDIFLAEARNLIDEAKKQDILLRVMGPIALNIYFPEFADLYRRMERLGDRVFTDIDFASYGKYRGKMVPFFHARGYELEKRAAMLSGNTRHIYYGSRVPMIDVFFDELSYNHPIDYRGRLEIHPYCVSVTDLLLQKLQIIQVNDKDIKDALLLLLAATIGDSDIASARQVSDDHPPGSINIKYLSKLMSDDWGFYYTSTTNLAKIKMAVDQLSVFDEAKREIIRKKVDAIVLQIENAPKSGKWKGRAKVGTRKPWYNDVTDWS